MPVRMDLHVHSTISKDGADPIPDMCCEAVKKNIKIICFTEHLDLANGIEGFDFDNYSKLIDRARREYSPGLKVLKGVEVGEPHLHPKEFEKVLKLDFDMILGAVHWIGNHFVGENDLERLYTKDQIFEMYFIELLKSVEFGGFDVIAHFDFPKRYLGENFYGKIEGEVLEKMKKNGIALELNTSTLRKGIEEPMPGIYILTGYSLAGGQIITTGSDAHSRAEIGSGFDILENMIENIKSLKTGYFEGRKFKEDQ